MDGTMLVAAGTAVCCFLGWIESRAHREHLARIPIRIHVNGTRGKSGVTRLIAAGLRAGGMHTFAKTTGTLARAIFPDGTEYPVFRPARANVIEQLRVARVAARQNVDALVISMKSAELIDECSRAFGSQCVVLAIDARRSDGSWEAYTHGGRTPTGRDAVRWASQGVARGAGEILLTSMDRDGTKDGYDIELLEAVRAAVTVPVIASGGAGTIDDCVDALRPGRADAVLAASIFHRKEIEIEHLKRGLADAGIPVRLESS